MAARLHRIALSRPATVKASIGAGGTRTGIDGSGGTGVPAGTIADRRPLRVEIGDTTGRALNERN